MTDFSTPAPAPAPPPTTTAPQLPAPSSQLPPPVVQPVTSAPTLQDNLNTVLKTAPDLVQSPGLAVGVASSGGNPERRAQSIARTANAISDSHAVAHVAAASGGENPLAAALNWFGNSVQHVASVGGHDLLAGGKTLLSDVGGVLNKPLSTVQHEYRYLHDVEARHGPMAALLEGVGLAAGAAGGFAIGGTEGAALGAEGVGYLEGQVFYRDSWARTNSGSYEDPHTHQQVSLGRDVASVLGLRPGTTTYKLGSGLIDGIADMGMDPLAVGGRLMGAARSAEGIQYGLDTIDKTGARPVLGRYFSGTAPVTAEDVEQIYHRYPSVQRAFGDIASKNASEIIATPAYAPLRQIATQLGEAQTPEDVAQVFKDIFRTQELALTNKLPTLSWTRLHFGQALRERVEAMAPTEVLHGPGTGLQLAARVGSKINPANWAQRFTRLPEAFDSVAKELSDKEFDPQDPVDNGALGLYRMLRYTENRPTATSIVQHYLNTPSLEGKINVYRQASLNMLFSMAGFRGFSKDQYLEHMFEDPEMRAEWGRAIDNALAGGMFGKEAWYGVDENGRNLSKLLSPDGWQYGAGITENQTGKLKYISLSDAREVGRKLAGAKDIFGRLDGFAYDHFTQGVFKPLVLMTPSYAFHISLAELIPNAMRLGVRRLVRAGIAENIAKLGYKAGVHDYGLERIADASDAVDRAVTSGDLARIGQAKATLEAAKTWGAEHGYASGIDRAISGLIWRSLDKVSRGQVAALVHDPEALASSAIGRRIWLMARRIEHEDGAFVEPGLSTGHNVQAEIAKREESSVNLLRRAAFDSGMRPSGSFATFSDGQEQYLNAWAASLRELARDPKTRIAAQELLDAARAGRSLDEGSISAAHAATAWLRQQDQAYLDKFLRSNDELTSFPLGRPPGMDALDEFGHVTVRNLRGAVIGKDRQINIPILRRIAEADGDFPETTSFDARELADVPEEHRPLAVKGREMVPAPPKGISTFANWGFRRVLNPIVNFLSRQPIAAAEFEKQWAHVAPLVENGTMAEDEAFTRAETRTVNEVIKNVHNIHDRTQWTVALRNWAPFFFAQEQAYRRMGRLLAEDPGAFRRYQLMISGFHDVGQVLSGNNGQGYFVVPGTGFMTQGVAEAMGSIGLPVEKATPVGMGWNLSASSVIFPLSAGARPDLGPLVSFPIQAIAQMFPEMGAPAFKGMLTGGANAVLGQATASQDIWSQLIPNVVAQRILTAAGGVDQRSFMSTMMQTLLTLDYEHKLPSPTAGYNEWQQFIDRVKNQTRIMYVMKALVGAVTPISPEVTDPTYNKFYGELSSDIQASGSVIKGTQMFLSKNPDASPYTVFQSYSPTGASPPDSVAAEQWINNNQAFISKYPYSAFYFMPQLADNKYNATVYNEQLAQGYRVKYNPEANPVGHVGSSFLAQLYIAAGNSVVFDNPENYPAYVREKAQQTGTQKYETELRWQNFIAQYSQQNPVWGAYWSSNTKSLDRGQAITEVQRMIATNELPDPHSLQSQEIVALMDGYQQHQQQLAAGAQDAFATQSQSSINQEWQDNLTTIAERHPELRAVISGLFMSLPTNLPSPPK